MKITARLALGFFAILLLLCIIGASCIYFCDELMKNNAENIRAYAEDAFLSYMGRDISMLSSSLDIFINNENYKKVYLEKDREKLYDYAKPLFDELKEKYGITHLYFILPDGHVFLRVHNKGIYGDLVERSSLLQAREIKQMSHEMELGKTAFALRAVAPYYHNGELVGYVEFGQEIEHFLYSLKGETRNEYYLVADKEHLSREDWALMRAAAGLRDSWDDSEEHLVIGSTASEEMGCFKEEYIEKVEKNEQVLAPMTIGNSSFFCDGFVLWDLKGEHIGAVLAMIDTTDEMHIAKRIKYMTLAFIILAFLLAAAISFYTYFSVSRPLKNLTRAFEQVGKGDLSLRTEAVSKDEIGGLALVFRQMVSELKKTKIIEKHYKADLEKKVKERTKEALAKTESLEQFKRLAVGRELRMIELKKRIKGLERKTNK
ncbi:MAG: cache domain-containing protein [Nanoarchaeota archaeon]